ncbi:TRAP transporter small permease [Rhodocyclaceae bacterium SMB388]
MDPLSADELKPARATWAEGLLAQIATAAVAMLCVLVTVSVLSRLLGQPLIPDSVLLVQEMMVLVILFPLAVLTAMREQIAVTVFTQRAGERSQRLLAAVGHVVGLVFGGVLLWASSRLLMRSLATGEYYYGALDIPMWIGHAVFALGAAAFVLRLVVMLLIDLNGAMSRRKAQS